MRATADNVALNAVDLYNGVTGTWSTAQLSVAREGLAAASVGNVALFAGGFLSGALLCREGGRSVGGWLRACWMFAHAAVFLLCLPCHRLLSHARHYRCC